MFCKNYQSAYLASALTLCFGLASPAYSQTAGQLVQDSYAPPIIFQPAQGRISFAGSTGLDVPAGAEQLFVTPTGLEVSGGLTELEVKTALIDARIRGKRVTAGDLVRAAKELEAAYAQKGYFLARVTIPPQTIEDGQAFKLVVTEGYIEAIDLTDIPEHKRAHLEALLSQLASKKGLTRQELERQILLASDTPGLQMTSTLKAGEQEGGTILALAGTHKPITATVGLDNGLSKELGHYNATLGLDFNNSFGMGEVIYLRLAGYPGFNASLFDAAPRNRQLIAGVSIPLGADGWWLNLEGVDSRTNPQSELSYQIEDHYQRAAVNLGYHWMRSRNFNTSTVISFEAADADQIMHMSGASDWSKDKLRVFDISQRFDAYLPTEGTINASLTASFGIDGLGARSGTSTLPLSREGAEPEFQKLEFALTYRQPIALATFQPLHLSIATKGQTSFGHPLMASEQMGLGGFDWLTAFNSGKLQGDSALAIRTEVAYPLMMPTFGGVESLNSQVTPYLFAAAGIAKLEQTTALERTVTRSHSLGLGLRYGLSDPKTFTGAHLSLEYAHGSMRGGESDNRFNLRLQSSF